MSETFTHRLRVRYSECDQQGMVFNGHFLFYLDVALTEWWRAEFGGYQVMVGMGYDLVVAETTLRYLSPVRFDDLVDVTLAVSHLGTTSLLVRATYHAGERLAVDGDIRYVFVDRETQAKRPMPDGFRAALERYRVPDG